MQDEVEYLTPTMQNRVIKEMKKDNIIGELVDNRYLYVPIDLPEPFNRKAKEKNKDPALILKLDNYPWKAPKIFYLSTKVERIYKITPMFSNILTKITNKKCLCCDSFICPNNWVCSNKLIDIINEFNEIVSLKKRVVEIFYCNKIQKEKIPNGLPIKDFAISQYL